VAYLPTYTPTGTHTTLAVPHITANGVNGGDGWFDAQDTAALMVPIASCSYPDPYGGALLPQPTDPFCGGAATAVIPTPVAYLTVDADGNPVTSITLVSDGAIVPGAIEPTATATSTTAVVRRFAPRANLPLATLG